jgi:hydroxymethylpyrimidine/phosphomethylpyrimidine kinase
VKVDDDLTLSQEVPVPPKAMTIAGSDSGGGAGIQADLKTLAALGVYGTSALTAVTAQNTRGVYAVAEVPEEVIALQIDVVLEDIGADAVKTGMLSSASIVETVAARLEAWGVKNLVVDPVMVAKSGHPLLQESAVAAVKTQLLPLALVATPNVPEAEILAGVTIDSRAAAARAAEAIAALGPRYVIVKGGHMAGDATDLVFDGERVTEFPAERIETLNTHGTGCSYSAAIAAFLARGLAPLDAIGEAKAWLTGAIRHSYTIGGGHSPVNHFYAVEWTPSRRGH